MKTDTDDEDLFTALQVQAAWMRKGRSATENSLMVYDDAMVVQNDFGHVLRPRWSWGHRDSAERGADRSRSGLGSRQQAKTPGSRGFRAFRVVAGARSDRLHTDLRRLVVQMQFRS